MDGVQQEEVHWHCLAHARVLDHAREVQPRVQEVLPLYALKCIVSFLVGHIGIQ
jgi:hypothetical protein